ncbi:flagellar export chaperone FliS [Microbacterium sp. zg.Y1090]|uniref:flagellar export chaperone FliS n=1 Tax=Microbacterium TaxID=33882 RepID=UPI00214AA5C1|nr:MULTISPECIES: flagellar export chaperone FliS [unclassified Microbacterium]MCR2813973.1 flagellar export chaperone FliS [Microbacterium sp. zg.Y1084]MCR2819247.1 flagellar export chaperone FliS [Microbacterium sp. zg.Y1090]MDL5487164.1 flagellar export chaperone FliS [Microbacterium sp. zg-Y1211]WIM28229.1 flagellar export chaperone FliS [Microbacterium sp. zg-Y1090]
MSAALRAQQRYREEAILSASPQRLVTMLYDRLLLDVARAETAQRAGDWVTANSELQHAQSIVNELSSSLSAGWAGSTELQAVYAYLIRTLIGANIARDPERTRECRDLIAPLHEAWHAAAAAMAPQP